MGHTVMPLRFIIYEKMSALQRLVRGLREPEKRVAEEMINGLYRNISAISYANPLPKDLENNLIFSMLLQEKRKLEREGKKGDIDDLTLKVFAMIIQHRVDNYQTNTNKGGEGSKDGKENGKLSN